MPIEIGQPFPPFSLPAIDAAGLQTRETNETLRGQKTVIFVYPKDQTSGCTVEACSFRDSSADFAAKDVKVLGISRDSIRSHTHFIAKQNLKFPLLSDEGGAWMRENGLIYDAKMYGKAVTKVRRTTYLLDEKGVVLQVWENVTPADHAREILEWIAANSSK